MNQANQLWGGSQHCVWWNFLYSIMGNVVFTTNSAVKQEANIIVLAAHIKAVFICLYVTLKNLFSY